MGHGDCRRCHARPDAQPGPPDARRGRLAGPDLAHRARPGHRPQPTVVSVRHRSRSGHSFAADRGPLRTHGHRTWLVSPLPGTLPGPHGTSILRFSPDGSASGGGVTLGRRQARPDDLRRMAHRAGQGRRCQLAPNGLGRASHQARLHPAGGDDRLRHRRHGACRCSTRVSPAACAPPPLPPARRRRSRLAKSHLAAIGRGEAITQQESSGVDGDGFELAPAHRPPRHAPIDAGPMRTGPMTASPRPPSCSTCA